MKQKLLDYLEPEFLDFLYVLEMGANKYGNSNWLKTDGKSSSYMSMHDSMGHHWAESLTGHVKDEESGHHPLLHLIARAMLIYTKLKRGLIHDGDKTNAKIVEIYEAFNKEFGPRVQKGTPKKRRPIVSDGTGGFLPTWED